MSRAQMKMGKSGKKGGKRVARVEKDESEDEAIQLFSSVKSSKAQKTSDGSALSKPQTKTVQAKVKSAQNEDMDKHIALSKTDGGLDIQKGLLGGKEEARTFTALGLERWLVNACENMGLKRPTDVQWNCIPVILKNRHVLASAQTGSGKTAAFALPILQLLSQDPFGVFAVVLTPTRELAFQIRDQFVALGTQVEICSYVTLWNMWPAFSARRGTSASGV